MSESSGNEILVVKFGAIGDCIMTLAAIVKFKKENPDSQVTWMLDEGIVSLAKATGVEINFVPFSAKALYGKKGIFQRVKESFRVFFWGMGKKFDIALVAYRSPLYRYLLGPFISAKSWRSFQNKGDLRPGLYQADEIYRALHMDRRQVKGNVDFSSISLSIDPAQNFQENPKRVLIAPGAAKNDLRDDGLRRWPVDSYVQLAKNLQNDGYIVGIIGSDVDQWVVESFKDLSVENYIGKTSLLDLVDLMKKSGYLVSHDSGPMHLGFLSGIKTIALFGPTEASEKVPVSLKNQSVMQNDEIRCRPCYDGQIYADCSENICLSTITPNQVLDQMKTL